MRFCDPLDSVRRSLGTRKIRVRQGNFENRKFRKWSPKHATRRESVLPNVIARRMMGIGSYRFILARNGAYQCVRVFDSCVSFWVRKRGPLNPRNDAKAFCLMRLPAG